MADIEKIQRKSHGFAIVLGIAIFGVILMCGGLTYLYRDSAANQQQQSNAFMGRLHNKISATKETPWIDVAADRSTLDAWRGIFEKGRGGPTTQAEIAEAYSNLRSTGKLLSVKPDTLVHIVQRVAVNDCYITILYGDNREHSGWVDCRWITN